MLTRFANRYNFAFLASLVLLGILYVEGRRTEVQLRAANRAAVEAMARVSASQNVMSALQEIESSGRGYLITQSPVFRQTFDMGRAKLAVSRDQLRRSLPDDAWHARWLANVLPRIDARVQASNAIVEAVARGDSTEGTRLVRTFRGHNAMEDVRRHIATLQAHADASLRIRNAGIRGQATRTDNLRLAMLVAAGLLLLSAVLAINFHAEKRRQALVKAREGEARERRQYAFLRTIIDSDENPIFVRDADGRFILSNQALGTLAGCPVEEIEGPQGPNADCLAMLQPLLADDDAVDEAAGLRTDAVRMIDVNWTPRWFQVAKRVLPGDGPREVLTVAVDISERMRAEKMKDEFVSTVSHELRTPLTSVRGAVDLLGGMDADLPAAARPLVDIARKNAERLLSLINDVLDLQSLDGGHLRLRPGEHAVRGLLEQAVLHNTGYAAAFDVALTLVPGDDGALWVDADRFAQVMANLLSNAIKHSPKQATVEVEAERVGEVMEIRVRDHGRGIPRDFRPHVFERFTQAESTDARRKGGTGLGLAIARTLVERMGGQIGFDTAEGLGTTFHLRFPLHGVHA